MIRLPWPRLVMGRCLRDGGEIASLRYALGRLLHHSHIHALGAGWK
jgi:hypothetical protein